MKSLSQYSITAYWAIAEERAYQSNYWSGLENIYQGVGKLGERLNKVYSELYNKYDVVFFFGADSPQSFEKKISQMIEEFCSSND